MRLHLPSLDLLIHELNRLPGVGQKTAQRLAYHILRSPSAYGESLSRAIHQVQQKITFCHHCYAYTEEATCCHICSDAGRASDTICVVKIPSDIMTIESSRAFHGRYHVLHGTLNPLEGIGPEDLKIKELILRIEHSLETPTPVKEIIMAMDADLEGDTTVLYINKVLHATFLERATVRISRIAHGVPIGSHIEFIDYRTLGRALENRVEL